MSVSARRDSLSCDVYLITCAPLRAAARFFSSASEVDTSRARITPTAMAASPAVRTLAVKPLRSALQLELAQVGIACPRGGEGVGGLIVLDEIVLNSRLRAPGEESPPWDGARADVHHPVIWRSGRILDMYQWKPTGPAREIRERVLAALRDPVEVHLKGYGLRVGALEQGVVADAPLHPSKLEVVVVIGKAEARGPRLFAESVEQVRGGAVAPQRPAFLLREPGDDEVLVPDLARRLQRAPPVLPGSLDRHVGGGRGEPGRAEGGAGGLRAPAVVAGELDFAEADGGEPAQRPLEVLLQKVPDRVELYADRPRPGRGQGG